MIEQVLIFGLGFLVAGLLWLILLPAFWNRAVRLTRERIERALPMSLNEISAEQDRLRASFAVEQRRAEQAVERSSAALLDVKTQMGARVVLESGFLDTIAQERQTISDLRTHMADAIAALEAQIAARDVHIRDLEAQLAAMRDARDLGLTQISGLSLQRDALTGKLNTTIDLAEQRRIALDDATSMNERLRLALDEETQRNAQLRVDLQARVTQLRDLERQMQDRDNDQLVARLKQGGADPATPVSG